jgi:hypothetical protein
LNGALAKHPPATVAEGFRILKECRQAGEYSTKYSNVFDLLSGDVFLYPFPGRDAEVKLNLATELAKGAHYYDMPKLQEQLALAPLPLPLSLERLPVDKYKPIPDQEPEVTAHLRAMIRNARDGTPHPEDFTAEFWKELAPRQKEIQESVTRLGDLLELTLVDRTNASGQRIYRYRADFAHAIVLQRFVLNTQNQCVTNTTEAVELKQHSLLPPQQTNAPLVGIGVVLREVDGHVIIQEIVPGSSAAAQKDIRIGDRILAIAQGDGPAIDAKNLKIGKMAELIRGPAGSTVRLALAAAGEDNSNARTVSVIRAELIMPSH